MTAADSAPGHCCDLSKLPAVLAEAVELNLERFIEVADPEQQALAFARPELPAVWAASDFVSEWCIRDPARLDPLIRSGQLDHGPEQGEIAAALADLAAAVGDVKQLDRTLRQYRNAVMVRIAWRDLAGQSTMEETIGAVSALADASLDLALERHHDWLCQRHGVPRETGGKALRMSVLGLGKLGGHELNYSSDIDLIFAYEGAGQTDGVAPDGEPATGKVLDNQEFFIRLGRKVVASLNHTDADGFVFRTDMRLRPNGDSGPLVLPFAAMENYYQTHGRDWERYALIKARVVAGDRGAGAELLEMLRPFVYRKYLDFSAFDAIREMKSMIERELAAERNERDVKLGRGGIREIEFLVQNHQLIRGGREAALQTTSLYQALDALVALEIVSDQDRETLVAAYRFLRNVEHRLQMVADRQTQSLPNAAPEKARLAFSMGYKDWGTFKEALNQHRDQVHRLFKRVLAIDHRSEDAEQDNNRDTEQLGRGWAGQLPEDAFHAALDTAGFSDPAAVARLLQQFRGGGLYRAFSTIERDRLNRLMPLALHEAGGLAESDRAVIALIGVIEAIGHRSVYLSLLIENPGALRQLMQLCGASPWIARHIGQHPVVLDELLGPTDVERDLDHRALVAALHHRLEQNDPDDVEQALNTLREFYHAQVLRIAAADLKGHIDHAQTQRALSELAEVVLEQALADAVDKVSEKQGPPPGEVGIIAYGKFAGHELGYHSDLDIVVCFEAAAGVAHANAEYFFSRVGQRLISLITTRTRAGTLFELDMRLRPSGRSGTLVTSLKSFAEYQQASAWTWEHQALVRARMVAGPAFLREGFEAIRLDVLAQPRDPEVLKQEIVSMRQRMIDSNSRSSAEQYDLKLDHGGIVDVEFLLQYLVLLHASDHPRLAEPRHTDGLIQVLAEFGLLTIAEASALGEIWATYMVRSLHCKLLDRPLLIGREELVEERQQVSGIWSRLLGDGADVARH